jgi:predicted ABC-type ATPase
MDNAIHVMILAGPNGAGKSTMAKRLFANATPVRHYVNADTIAKGLSEFHSEDMAFEAGRIMLAHIKNLATQRVNFAFETTLATRGFAPWLRKLKEDEGYRFHLFYLWLPTADMAVNRVSDRVRLGGHHVPEDTIRRRYQRGIANFFGLYRPLADEWKVYDNARPDIPVLVAKGAGTITEVIAEESWREFQRIGSVADAEPD